MQFGKTTLVGMGLLGGSLGIDLRRLGVSRSVTACVRRPEAAAECLRLGAADAALTDPVEAVRDADLVVLCTPVGEMRALAARFAPHLRPGALVTDVGSVKAGVVRELEPIVAAAGGRFVGSHPMAGSEKTGLSAARPGLFAGAVCVVTPAPGTDPDALARVDGLWASVGSEVLRLAPEVHDELVCRSSHLPHVVAAALARHVLDPSSPPGQARVCASGFRDTTRVASGSPVMWRDIALANRDALSRVLEEYVGELEGFRRALDAGDAAAVESFFTLARDRRERWLAGARPAASPE